MILVIKTDRRCDYICNRLTILLPEPASPLKSPLRRDKRNNCVYKL